MSYTQSDVKQKYSELRINLISPGKGIREADIKLYVLLLFYPNMTVYDIADVYHKVDSYQGFKSFKTVNRSMDRLKNIGLVTSVNKGNDRKSVWNANIDLITHPFLSYKEARPDDIYKKVIDKDKFQKVLRIIQEISQMKVKASSINDYETVSKALQKVGEYWVPHITNSRMDELEANEKKLVGMIDQINLRNDPMQIHRQLLEILYQLQRYLKAKQVILGGKNTRQHRQVRGMMDKLRQIVSESETSEQSIRYIDTFQNQHLQGISEEVKEAIKECGIVMEQTPLYFERLNLNSTSKISELINDIDLLVHQFELYIKEYVFVKSKIE